MANTKVTEEDRASSADGTELIRAVKDGANVALTSAQIAALATGSGQPGYTANALVWGGSVVWEGGLVFTVGAAVYVIAGITYESPQTQLTLSAGDATDPRIDLIVFNTSSVAAVIEGTPAATPAAPDVDPATQLQRTFATVPVLATEPADLAVTDIYHEDAGEAAEWTSSVSGASMNAGSTSNPRSGTKCIEATAAVNGNYFQLADAAAYDTSVRDSLTFHIRSKAAWPSSKSLTIRWYSGTSAKGSGVSFINGSFGFDSSNTTDYQPIRIPMWLFGVAALSVDRVRFTVAGGGAAIGFYVDDIELQGGVSSDPVASDGARATIAPTAPSGSHGKLWWNSTTGTLMIYYDDGSSAQWVEA